MRDNLPIGENSQEWQESSLGKYVKVQGGFAFKSADFIDSGVPVIKIKNVRLRYVDIEEVDCVSVAIAEEARNYFLSDGDIVISMTGSGPNAPNSVVGRVARYTGESGRYLINQRVGRLIVKDTNKVDKRFLFFLLSQKEIQEWLVSNSTGSANQANISNGQIESLHFKFPPISEQISIAGILGSLDDKIELNQRIVYTLEGIAQALFKSWFVNFDPVQAKAEGREPEGMDDAIASLFPSNYKDSLLGLIPEGWEVLPLAKCSSTIRRGLSPSYVENGGIRVVNQKCIRNRQINFELSRRHDDTKKPITDRLLELGDILINSTGVGTLGRVAQLWHLEEPTTFDSHVTLARANRENILPVYLGLELLRKEAKIESLGEGSVKSPK